MAEAGNKLQIRFGKSSSQQYKSAVKIAQQFSHCYMAGKDHIITITPETIQHDIEFIDKLWNIIKGWKNSKILVSGTPKKVTVFECLRCYSAYENAVIQELHCKRTKEYPGWSCKQLLALERHAMLSSYPWDNRLWWFQVGYFKSDQIWIIDKTKIEEILRREIDLKCLWLCPIFDWNRVKIHIENLPDSIDLSISGDWIIDYVIEPGLPDRPIGIKPKYEPINYLSAQE